VGNSAEPAMPTSIELFEDRAQGCIEAAERADDPDVRKLLLKTAREWMQGAAALRRAAANGAPLPTSEDDGAPSDDDRAA
jgi:hypothetical protein